MKIFEEAFAALETAVELSGKRPFVVADLGRAFAEAKKKKEARAILKNLDGAAKTYYISPLNRAKIYLGLGETEKVFEHLEKGFKERSVRLPWLLVDPQFDNLRSNERFMKITKKMESNF